MNELACGEPNSNIKEQNLFIDSLIIINLN
jgi:hypothetical protein